jgi:hypothetical protein
MENDDLVLRSSINNSMYIIKVYVMHGYFEYSVPEMASALEHAGLIMERGVYRRSRGDGTVEFHKVIKTKVCGPGLESEYLDTFKRT